jgi:hypothetical protein
VLTALGLALDVGPVVVGVLLRSGGDESRAPVLPWGAQRSTEVKMNKVVWHITMSVDGYIAGPGDEMDWMGEYELESPVAPR